MKKILLPGLLGGALLLIISMAFSMLYGQIFPSVAAEYLNPALFRSWSDPLMLLFYLHPFILMIILAWVWDLVKNSVHGKSDWVKGYRFGLVIWLIATLPGMLITYGSFTFSFLMVLDWTLGSLIGLILSCWIFPKFNR